MVVNQHLDVAPLHMPIAVGVKLRETRTDLLRPEVRQHDRSPLGVISRLDWFTLLRYDASDDCGNVERLELQVLCSLPGSGPRGNSSAGPGGVQGTRVGSAFRICPTSLTL